MTRLDLDRELRTLVEHVYFQPPANVQLEYDCIVYQLDNIYVGHADDTDYINKKRYQITLVTKKWNEELIDRIMRHFPGCQYGRPFRSDNLYHNIFFIYY